MTSDNLHKKIGKLMISIILLGICVAIESIGRVEYQEKMDMRFEKDETPMNLEMFPVRSEIMPFCLVGMPSSKHHNHDKYNKYYQ